MRALIALIVACTLASCDLFTTRTPEPPALGSTFIWTPASTVQTLLDDFTGSLAAVDASNYARCFVSSQDTVTGSPLASYTFTPRAGLDPTSKTVFESWTQTSEQTFLTKLSASLVSNPVLTVTLSNTTIDQSSGTNAQVKSDYVVLLPLPQNSTLPSSISGTLIFQAVLASTEQGTKEWRVLSWSDFVSSNSSAKTFSDLKVQLAS